MTYLDISDIVSQGLAEIENLEYAENNSLAVDDSVVEIVEEDNSIDDNEITANIDNVFETTVNDEINNALNNYLESESDESNSNLEESEIEENIDDSDIEIDNELIDELKELDNLVEDVEEIEENDISSNMQKIIL